MTTDTVTAFTQLALIDPILKALDEVGYETPSPIQAETIPLLLQGRDVLGQAQTGTGKTAAFALPILSRLDLNQKDPQVLVLAPTRELAIQVAEAFQKYARHLQGFHVLPVYGGQDYRGQIHALKRGVHVVVGTPGRVMDHMRRGTLKLDRLSTLVLDEADEMLRMGFIDDVEWVLEQSPADRQIALFSATMPQQIRRIAAKYLNKPEQITIKTRTTTVETIRQRFWPVSGVHKLDALTRILEAEHFDAMLVFVRTKTATLELAEKLEARGYDTAALNGDIPQNQRERTVQQLKNGKLDILVATDVAARGLDVERISHVVNYDIPYDTEAYVHRIGRTGRAGRKGDAILFVAPRERRMLSAIEKATRQKIDIMELPSTELINDKRIASFKQRITDTLANEELELFTRLIEQYEQEHNVPAQEVAAALARLLQGDTPLLLQHKPQRKADTRRDQGEGRPVRKQAHKPGERSPRKESQPEEGMLRFRLEVGHKHKVKPGNIVGAIANEAGLDSEHIGRISIYDDYSLVDLPEGMPKGAFNNLKKAWVSGQRLNISRVSSEGGSNPAGRRPVAAGTKAGKARHKSTARPGKVSKKKVRKNKAATA
ncbi:MAG: DEAD/DEAH box helicase [Gammaproteobacteria bacterium]|jgi:ATP-dependent RNA helicase DeaD